MIQFEDILYIKNNKRCSVRIVPNFKKKHNNNEQTALGFTEGKVKMKVSWEVAGGWRGRGRRRTCDLGW